MNRIPELVVSCIIAYLLGSLSGGIITSRLAHGPDLRTVGSKNTGASNVQRTMGWKYGLITFFFDVAKGILSCLIAELLTADHQASLLAGLCCVIGHNWPVFFGFRGGKGVATTGGIMLYCYPVPALICIGITCLVIAITKYISLGSMLLVISFALFSIFSFSNGNLWIILWACVLMLMCLIRHHANIGRLIRGTENKLGQKAR